MMILKLHFLKSSITRARIYVSKSAKETICLVINFVIISQYKLIKDKVCPWGKRNFTFYYYYMTYLLNVGVLWKRPQFFTPTLFTVMSALSTYLVCFFSTFMENGWRLKSTPPGKSQLETQFIRITKETILLTITYLQKS